MTKPPVKIDSSDGSAYLTTLQCQRGIVALLGSGVSIWEPSNLPNGQQVTNDLAAIIANSTVSPKRTVTDLIRRSPFEHIMARYPKRWVLTEILSGAYYPTDPNLLHEAFAHLLNDGIVDHIITTNYDVGLEAACLKVCNASRQPQIIVEEKDLRRMSITQPVIFKIHGCASPALKHSMVITLDEEGEMERWKRELLASLVKSKSLIVCGYSGLDFDICAELAQMEPTVTTWNSFSDPNVDESALTGNAKKVIAALDATVLVGDMKKMLETLAGKACNSGWGMGGSFVSKLVDELKDDWLVDKWRVWVLNGLSCSRDGIEVAKRMYSNSGVSVEHRLDSLLALAEPLFHGGFYFQAGTAYREAALLAQSSGDMDKRLKAELGVVESDRVAGYLYQAWRKIRRLEKTLPALARASEREKVEAAIALKWVLLQKYPYRLAKLFPPFANRIRHRVKERLIKVANYSATGSWFDFQHCEMLARDYDIPFNEVYLGTLKPLASHEGYRHLGYILAEMMAYRKMLDSGLSKTLNYNYMILADEIGCNPEVWKIATAIKRCFGRKALPTSVTRLARQAKKNCEYTLLMKVLLYLRGE